MKDERIQIRINGKYYERIKEKAEAAGMNISDFMIFMAVNGKINCHAGKSAEMELMEDLKAIDSIKKIGGIDTSEELLETRKQLAYRNYLKKVDCTDTFENIQNCTHKKQQTDRGGK